LALLLKHVLIQQLQRKGVFRTADGRKLSKLTLEEIQQEYTRIFSTDDWSERNGLVESNS
jgi:hypothetical protein